MRGVLYGALAASMLLAGCSDSKETAAPAAGTDVAPVVSQLPVCAVEIQTAEGWTRRATIDCPGARSLHLLVVGDVGFAGPILDGSIAGAKTVCDERRCDVMLMVGDLIYGPGAEAEAHWKAIWDEGLARLGLPAVAVLGNHEWRHEPEPEKKRAAITASDDRAGLIAPGPSFAVRVVRAGVPLVAFAALDTDSVSNPGPDMPGLGAAALDAACGEGVPVIVVGHHPASSQGLHHPGEAHVEQALRTVFAERRRGGCDLQLAVAGHDHDLQFYPPACQEADVPAVVVAGVTARGFRKAGELHLPTCGPGPSEGKPTTYIAGRGEDGGFALVEITLDETESVAHLYATPAAGGAPELLASTPF